MKPLSANRFAFFALLRTSTRGRLAVLGAIATIYAPSACAADKTGWVLHQKMDFVGPATSVLTADAAKMTSARLTIFIAKPKWDVVICNMRTRCYCQSSYAKWEERHRIDSTVHIEITKSRPVKEKIAGVSVSACECIKIARLDGNRKSWQQYKILSSKDIDVPHELCRAYWATFELPDMPGFPIQVLRQDSRTHPEDMVLVLRTFDCKHQKISAADVAAPPKLKRVSNEMDVLLDEDPSLEPNRGRR